MLMAREHGRITEIRTEAFVLGDLDSVLKRDEDFTFALGRIDRWLSRLSDDEMALICGRGDRIEISGFMRESAGPAEAESFLELIRQRVL